jgi:hypothetical protein
MASNFPPIFERAHRGFAFRLNSHWGWREWSPQEHPRNHLALELQRLATTGDTAADAALCELMHEAEVRMGIEHLLGRDALTAEDWRDFSWNWEQMMDNGVGLPWGILEHPRLGFLRVTIGRNARNPCMVLGTHPTDAPGVHCFYYCLSGVMSLGPLTPASFASMRFEERHIVIGYWDGPIRFLMGDYGPEMRERVRATFRGID